MGRSEGMPRNAIGERLLPPAGNRHAEEEGDEETSKRSFARDCRDGRESSAGLSRFLDGGGQTIDGGVQASGDFTDRAGDIRRRIDGTLGHAGLGRGLRYLRAQGRDLRA